MSKKTKAHTRYYLSDKTLVPGCTTVLGLLAKPALVPWANKLGLAGVDVKKYVDDKAEIGTLGHLLVTDQLAGEETDTSDYSPNTVDRATNCALSFWAWEKEHPIRDVLFVEKPLVSEMFRFGGTNDLYVQTNGHRELIDLKTGNGIWPEHKYQVAALKVLLEENGFPVDRVRVLNIPRAETESFAEHVLTEHELEVGWEIFKHCLGIYYAKKRMDG